MTTDGLKNWVDTGDLEKLDQGLYRLVARTKPELGVDVQVTLRASDHQLIVEDFTWQKNLKPLQYSLNLMAMQHYGPLTRVSLRPQGSALWFIFEFVAQTQESRNDQLVADQAVGTGGFKFEMGFEGEWLQLMVADVFGVGYVPKKFVGDALSVIETVLGVTCERDSLFLGKAPVLNLIESSLVEPESFQKISRLVTGFKGRPTVQFDEGGLKVLAASSLGFDFPELPISVLEAREFEAFAKIDQMIFDGDFETALRLCEGSEGNTYFLRRRSLVGLNQATPFAKGELENAMRSEPEALLFRATKVQQSRFLLDKNWSKSLKEFTTELLRVIGGSERDPVIGSVIPELLGDSYTDDLNNAYACYNSSLEVRPENVRILYKLRQLANQSGNMTQEIQCLQKLVSLESNLNRKAEFLLRIAEIQEQMNVDPKSYLPVVMRAYECDQSNTKVLRKIASALVAQGQLKQAINTIDRHLSYNSDLPAESKADLECIVGAVWRQLGRYDIAERRFRKALEGDILNTEALENLLELYREREAPMEMLTILEQLFAIAVERKDETKVRSYFELLSDLRHQGHIDSRYLTRHYKTFVKNSRITPEELDEFIDSAGVNANWVEIVDITQDVVYNSFDSPYLAKFLCALGGLQRTKANQLDDAAVNLLKAAELGEIDRSNFEFLKEYYVQRGASEKLAQAFEVLVAKESGLEKQSRIMEYLTTVDGLSEVKRDAMAFEAYLIDQDFEQSLMDRLSHYQRMDDVDGIARVAELINDSDEISQFRQAYWFDLMIDSLGQCEDSVRYEILDRIFEMYLTVTEDPHTVYQKAFVALALGPKELFRLYLKRALALGYLPDMDEIFVADALKGYEDDLGIYHELKARQADEPQRASSHARMAITYYTKSGNDQKVLDCLCMLSTLSPISDEDVGQIRALAATLDQPAQLISALDFQVKWVRDKARVAKYFEEMADIRLTRLQDASGALGYYSKVMDLVGPTPQIQRKYAEAARQLPNDQDEAQYLWKLLETSSEVEIVLESFARLAEISQGNAEFTSEFRTLLPVLLKNAAASLLVEILSALGQGHISDPAFYSEASKMAFESGWRSEAIQIWSLGVLAIYDESELDAYISHSDSALVKEGLNRLFLNREIDFGRPIGIRVALIYAAMLFDSESEREKATPIYQHIFQVNPNIDEVWIPLYFVLTEFGSSEERAGYLEKLIPLLKTNPRVLKKYPITMESLGNEFQKLRGVEAEPAPATPAVQAIAPLPSSSPSPAPAPVPVDMALDVPATPSAEVGLVMDLGPAPQTDDAPPPAPVVSETMNFDQGTAVDLDSSEASTQLIDSKENYAALDLSVVSGEVSEVAVDTEEPAPAPAPAPLLTTNKEMPTDQSGFALSFDVPQQLDGEPTVKLAESQSLELEIPVRGDVSEEASGQVENETPLDLFGGQSEGEGGVSSETEEADQNTGSLDFGLTFDQPVADEASEAPQSDFDNSLQGLIPDAQDLGQMNDSVSFEVDPSAPVEDLGELVDPDGLPMPTIDTPNLGNFRINDSEQKEVTNVELVAAIGLGDRRQEIEASISKLEIDIAQITDAPSVGEPEEVSPEPLSVEPVDGERPSQNFSSSQVARIADWRQLVNARDFDSETLVRIKNSAFDNELEKHIAIQCGAVIAGDFTQLTDWHWRVWRYPKEVGYALDGSNRYPKKFEDPILDSKLHKLIGAIAPVFAQVYAHRYSLSGAAKKLKVDPKKLSKFAQPTDWDRGLLAQVGLYHYKGRLERHRHKVFELKGLGESISFDGATRSLYFDPSHFKQLPPSVLLHRVMKIFWSWRGHSQYFVPLMLHPRKEIYPVLKEVIEVFNTQGVSKIKSLFHHKSDTQAALAKLDKAQIEKIKNLAGKVGHPDLPTVEALHFAMDVQVYRFMLAETLDLIGISESIFGKDLVARGQFDPDRMVRNPHVHALLDFAIRLILE